MNADERKELTERIIRQAIDLGATLAGIADINALRESPSYTGKHDLPDYIPSEHGPQSWPDEAKTVLVLALRHDMSEPELDWWDDGKGGTPGNRKLMRTARKLDKALTKDFNMKVWRLPYHVEKGGIFLKDAAALAGIGVIGKNNLLITPEYGPRVRLRALFLDAPLQPTGPSDFNPCETCETKPCLTACPRNAFETGSYNKDRCNIQMKADEARKADVNGIAVVKYCRTCEGGARPPVIANAVPFCTMCTALQDAGR